MEAQEHWMIHLQRVYYPSLAAIGIPCEYSYSYSFANCVSKILMDEGQ